MENPKFLRKGKRIINRESGEVSVMASINEAKRKSAELQKANGGLGRGFLRVTK